MRLTDMSVELSDTTRTRRHTHVTRVFGQGEASQQLVQRWIHYELLARNSPVILVNCCKM